MKTAKYFTAKWCRPCSTFSPIMDEVAKEGYSVQKIDVDANQAEAQQYGVRSVPTVVILEGGNEVARLVGVQTKQTVIDNLT